MQLELFQIIVPVIALLFIAGLIRRFYRSRASWEETLLGSLFWLAVILFAIFPDFISRWIAHLFGIKSNINAIIFFCIGLIFFFQYKLFFMIKKQQSDLTRLVRELSLQPEEEEKKEVKE
jgi:hypothetical protein